MTKADVYRLLIKLHKWTYDQIADMNIWQQMLAGDMDFSNVVPDLLEFATEADYFKWLSSKDT